MKLIFVRAGSALVFSEFGARHLNVGDVAVIAANTLCSAEPEGQVTITVLYLARDYMVDQVFWQYAMWVADRFDARDLTDELYADPAQLVRLGEDRLRGLAPWLDELVVLSDQGSRPERFFRSQTLLFGVLDVVLPFVRTSPVRRSPSQHRASRRRSARDRRWAPLRAEAHQVAGLLRDDPARRWTLPVLAERVHLSPKQLSRVFTDAYGKTPLRYLTMLRCEMMARLLRTTTMSITAAGRAVGWSSRSRAAEAFGRCVGMSPQRYRERLG